jgi:hypothetical protein
MSKSLTMIPSSRGALRALASAVLVAGLTACASTAMDLYVPAHCHGVAEPFDTYTLEFVDVPGFIDEVIATSLEGALVAQGLTEAPATEADVSVVSTFFLIDRNPPPQEEDPFGESVETGIINRFVTHLEVEVVDRRTDQTIWTGAMYRAHAIQGGETFHDERAVLIIRQAFDDMFVGLTEPCE